MNRAEKMPQDVCQDKVSVEYQVEGDVKEDVGATVLIAVLIGGCVTSSGSYFGSGSSNWSSDGYFH